MNTVTNAEKEKYSKYVDRITPSHHLGLQMIKAFVTGGGICLIGQLIISTAMNRFGLDRQTAGSWCSLILIFAAVLLTGVHKYSGLVEWGGAGALVPVTGFANSVASAAMEYQAEGQVFGVGCKIFTIAGPVILYGLLASWAAGFVFWITGL